MNIYGRFDEIIVDNGKEFAGVAMEHTLADLGTTLRLAPVASPQHKAIVERFFRTLNSLLVRKLPGAKLPIHAMRELGYDPQATAVLTVQEVEQLIWEALAVYHLDVHSGIGTPPALQWAWRRSFRRWRWPRNGLTGVCGLLARRDRHLGRKL